MATSVAPLVVVSVGLVLVYRQKREAWSNQQTIDSRSGRQLSFYTSLEGIDSSTRCRIRNVVGVPSGRRVERILQVREISNLSMPMASFSVWIWNQAVGPIYFLQKIIVVRVRAVIKSEFIVVVSNRITAATCGSIYGVFRAHQGCHQFAVLVFFGFISSKLRQHWNCWGQLKVVPYTFPSSLQTTSRYIRLSDPVAMIQFRAAFILHSKACICKCKW